VITRWCAAKVQAGHHRSTTSAYSIELLLSSVVVCRVLPELCDMVEIWELYDEPSDVTLWDMSTIVVLPSGLVTVCCTVPLSGTGISCPLTVTLVLVVDELLASSD
jgi:hypothetical protein